MCRVDTKAESSFRERGERRTRGDMSFGRYSDRWNLVARIPEGANSGKQLFITARDTLAFRKP